MVVVKFITDELGAERRVIVKDYVGGRRLEFEPFEGGGGMQICRWWKYFQQQPPIPQSQLSASKPDGSERASGNGGKWLKMRMERLVSLNPAHAAVIPPGTEQRWASGDDAFPRDGGEGPRGMAGWSWYPQPGATDELMFPRGAEIVEIEDVNGDWCHGFYMGGMGLFPAPYIRFGQGSSAVGLLSAEEV